MQISDMLNHMEISIRQNNRLNLHTPDPNITFSISAIQNLKQKSELTPENINKIGMILSELQDPETFGLISFLIQLSLKTTDPEIATSALYVIQNSYILPSFNPLSLANNEIFACLIQYLSGDGIEIAEKEDLRKLSIDIIVSIFESKSDRDFICLDIYNELFQYISSYIPDGNKIFLSIISNPKSLFEELFPFVFEVLVHYLSNPNFLDSGLFSLYALLQSGIQVPQELIHEYCEIFPQTLDEEKVSCLLYIMMYLDEPPYEYFDRIIEITQCSENLAFLGIRLLAFFCMKWNEEQKKVLISFLMSSLPDMSFTCIEKAMFCLVNLMNPLPTDLNFFSQLINIIQGFKSQSLFLYSAMQIVLEWAKAELTTEQLSLINDFQTILEELSLQSDAPELSDECSLYLKSIETLLS